MNRRTLFRALAALATLPLFGKAGEVEASPDAATECAAQGGEFARLSETEWRCALPEPGWLQSGRFDTSMSFDKLFVSIDPGYDGPGAMVIGEHLPNGRIRILQSS